MKHPHSAPFLFQISSMLLFVSLSFSTHPVAAFQDQSTFIDPTANLLCTGPTIKPCRLGLDVYIGPFATLKTPPGFPNDPPFISVGPGSNVQDNALLDSTTNNKPITLAGMVIIAHGATVLGGASIGTSGTCPSGGNVCPSFVGFNSEVAENAVVQRNAMVSHLARVGRNVTIPSGRVVLPGKNVTSNAEVPTKTIAIVDADRIFMDAVIKVNIDLAAGYNVLQKQDPSNVLGMNYNPVTKLNPTSTLPSLGGTPTRDPTNSNRIIGDVQFASPTLPPITGNVSLRADEGTPFNIGVVVMASSTFHALEHTSLSIGSGQIFSGSIVHGGKSNNGATSIGSNFTLGSNSVFFDSTAGNGCTIQPMSLVASSNLDDNTNVPSNIVLLANQESTVEWNRKRASDKQQSKKHRTHRR